MLVGELALAWGKTPHRLQLSGTPPSDLRVCHFGFSPRSHRKTQQQQPNNQEET